MGKITINGGVFEGDKISLKNNSIEVDDRDITAEVEKRPLKVEINSDIEKLYADLLVIVNGDVGSINCKSANCRDVSGNIQAGASVHAGVVEGSAWAGCSINCKGIEGNAIAAVTDREYL